MRGRLRAELCDAWGRKIDGYHLADSVPIHGDEPGHMLRWRDRDTARFQHDPVRLRLEATDADIYNIAF